MSESDFSAGKTLYLASDAFAGQPYQPFTSVYERPPEPYAPGDWHPLVEGNFILHLPDGYFDDNSPNHQATVSDACFRPLLGKIKHSRCIPATQWWDDEPVFILSCSKITRWNIVDWAANKDGGAHVDKEFPKPYQQLHANVQGLTVTTPRGQAIHVSHENAHLAALRQMAYEVSKSPELLKLAGR